MKTSIMIFLKLIFESFIIKRVNNPSGNLHLKNSHPAIGRDKFAHLHILLIGLSLLLTSCFSRFVMTEKELKEYYKDKKDKPTYFTIKNDSVELFCATSGADTLPPLLIVHGAPGAWYGCRNLLEDSTLRANFHMIAVTGLAITSQNTRTKEAPLLPSIFRQLQFMKRCG
jgi:hypothetical protein